MWVKYGCLGLCCTVLAACGSLSGTAAKAKKTARPAVAKTAPIQIRHINREAGAQELMLRSMALVGTPYRYGGSSRDEGFDCSGMVQFLYKDAFNVALPRTARDMAAVSRPIRRQDLKVGDVVFFNTGGHPYSHMGLYIGNGEFIHAPSSRGTIRTARLDQPYFSSRFTGAHTFFAP
nr:C40 family peptidase [Neisseria sp. HSC-16F19]